MNNKSNLVKNYGIMILRKNTTLYHTSDMEKLLNSNEDIFFLFCTFHPSDYGANHKYIHTFKLKRDVKLFFMINDIREKFLTVLNSSFQNLVKYNKINLKKINNNKINKFIYELKDKKFDGWFSSINNSSYNVEVALFNNKDVYEQTGTSNLIFNWTNFNNNNQYFNSGNSYQINTINNPIKLIINIKYKNNIKKLQNRLYKNNIFIPKSVFDVVINNADIIYFDENNHILNANNALKKYI
jgi:hypothetical protein